MKRIFLDHPCHATTAEGGAEDGGTREGGTELLRIRGADHHHICRVLRLGIGDEISLVDGSGWAFEGAIVGSNRHEVVVEVALRRELPAPRAPHLTLVYGLARGGKSEIVLQKATELGIDTLVPVICERSVARPRDAETKRARWLEIVRQASRQCERTRLPELAPPQPLKDALKVWHADVALVATLGGEALRSAEEALRGRLESGVRGGHSDQLASRHQPGPESVALAVGPEGGFTGAELALLHDAGFQPVSLGPLVLRSETAAIILTALAAYLAGKLD